MVYSTAARPKAPKRTAAACQVAHEATLIDEFDALLIEVQLGKRPADGRGDAAAMSSTAASDAEPLKLKFPAKLHARKVAQELGVKEGLIYLPGLPTPLYEDSDMGPAFRQRRYFYYLAGVDFENCAVTYDIGADRLVVWVPYIDPRQVLWYGTGPGPKDCLAAVDVDDVQYTTHLDDFLHERLGVDSSIIHASTGGGFCGDKTAATRQLKRAAAAAAMPTPTTLYVLHPSQAPAWLQELSSGSRAGAGRARPAVTVDDKQLRPAMDHARVVKSHYEIAMIRRANAISSAAHRAVLHGLKTMDNERQIEAVFLEHCIANYGAKMQAYSVIAGSGPNASVLHYFANDQPLAGRQLVCLDAGAEWTCYASDVTRTFPISGVFTPEAQAIYSAVHRMQAEVFERFAPGVPFAMLHLHAALVAVEELLRLGILRGAPARTILANGTVSAFFPHGLGHHVGLEVHDVLSSDLMSLPPKSEGDSEVQIQQAPPHCLPSLSGGGKRQLVPPSMYTLLAEAADAQGRVSAKATVSSSAGRPRRRYLEPGMIVTVEPGIYFCRPYIEAFFLADPKHARYINKEMLEQYYDVGGVRIEDCLLVTEDGHENLTTAPKGEEALRIINGSDGSDR